MSEITNLGLDLAKNVFQAPGADVSGRVLFSQEAEARPGSVVLQPVAALHCRHGSLRRGAFWGHQTGKLGHEMRPDPARLREALRQASKE